MTFDPNSFRIFSNLASANRKKIKPGTGWEYRATVKAELPRRFSSKFSLVRPALPPLPSYCRLIRRGVDFI